MSQDRREFLGTMLAVGAVGLHDGKTVRRYDGKAVSLQNEPTDLPSYRPTAQGPSEWDLSWPTRLTGKFRAAFDWSQPNASAGLWRAAIWKKQVAEHLGGTALETNVVLVIRHSAIPMIMGDAFWARHKLGKSRKIVDPFTGKTAGAKNPYRSYEGAQADSSIEGLIKGGGIVLACGFAFRFMAFLEAQQQKKKPEEVRAEVLKEVIPEPIQPSGFFALLEAQRNGCGLFPADVE